MEAPSATMQTQAGTQSLEDLMSVFNSRMSLLKQVLVIRSETFSNTSADLASLDIAVRAMEHQLRAVKARLKDEADALPKAKALIELSLQQELRLQHISGNMPANLPGIEHPLFLEPGLNSSDLESNNGIAPLKSMENAFQKEKKGRSPPPRWYITVDELDSLSSYMRGRLTLEKINTAVDEMATFAEANARLLAAPRKKLGEDMLEKALELRDFAASEAVKGKHFFFESDMKGPVLKMDNTGKAILTVLRHLGRISDVRIGRHRALVLLRS
eukprot:c2561_g1_i1 orf=134-949(+)